MNRPEHLYFVCWKMWGRGHKRKFVNLSEAFELVQSIKDSNCIYTNLVIKDRAKIIFIA